MSQDLGVLQQRVDHAVAQTHVLANSLSETLRQLREVLEAAGEDGDA